MIHGSDNYSGIVNFSGQAPIGEGAYALGFGGVFLTYHGNLSTVSSARFARRFHPSKGNLEVLTRSRDVSSVSASLIYSASQLTEYFASAGLSKNSAKTLSKANGSSSFARTVEIGASTSIFDGIRLQSSIGQRWHGGDRDTTFLIRITRDIF